MQFITIFTNYEINKDGVIRNKKTQKELKVTDGKVWLKIEGKSKQVKIENILSEVTFEEEVQPEVEKKTRKGRAIKVTLITGEVREYASAAEARRDLKIKHANAITAYWMKGHSLKAMNAAGIADIQYAD